MLDKYNYFCFHQIKVQTIYSLSLLSFEAKQLAKIKENAANIGLMHYAPVKGTVPTATIFAAALSPRETVLKPHDVSLV